MFCPICGGYNWEQLCGGRCSKSCVYCGKAIYCRCLFTDEDEIEEDSIPIKNPLKAAKLRRAYNKIPGNKEKGIKNTKENKAFHDEVKKNACKINDGMKELRKRMKNSKPIKFKEFDGTLEEFIKQTKKKK